MELEVNREGNELVYKSSSTEWRDNLEALPELITRTYYKPYPIIALIKDTGGQKSVTVKDRLGAVVFEGTCIKTTLVNGIYIYIYIYIRQTNNKQRRAKLIRIIFNQPQNSNRESKRERRRDPPK